MTASTARTSNVQATISVDVREPLKRALSINRERRVECG